MTANFGVDLGVDPSQVREELNRVLSSPKFRKSQSHCEFLRFVVERRLKAATVREDEIGVTVYRRGEGFDPSEDAIVRVEASRLRARLKEFYEEAGSSTGLRLELPKRGFMPVFVTEGGQMETRNQGIWLWTGILVALLGVLIIGGVAWKSIN